MANNTKTTEMLKNPGFLGELWEQVRLVFYLLKDRQVPIYLKILPFIGILYALFPVDFVADIIPVLGQLDDLTLFIIGLKVFIELSPSSVVSQYIAQMRGVAPNTKYVDGQTVESEPVVHYIEGEIVED